MTQAIEKTIELPHLRLAALVWGNRALPRLIALHGWLDNAASFDALAPLLCRHFHIVAIDLPGHGRSGHRPPGTWYHYIDYLGEVLTAADVMGWTRFGLLGHSLGGAIAAALAAACPDRIERLLLIEALGPLSGAADQALPQLRRALTQRGELQDKMLRLFPTIDAAVHARAKAGDLPEAVARTLVDRGVRPVDGGIVWASDSRLTLASPQRFVEAQVLAMLAGIKAPTRLVLADPPPAFLARDIIDARIAVVPGISVVRLRGHHHLHLDDPGSVAAALLEGLDAPALLQPG